MVDGSGIADPLNSVLKERTTLSDEGIVSISLAVDVIDDELLGEPVVVTKGFLYESEAREIVDECIYKIYSFARRASESDQGLLRSLETNNLRNQIRDYLFSKTKRRPLIIISVVEID